MNHTHSALYLWTNDDNFAHRWYNLHPQTLQISSLRADNPTNLSNRIHLPPPLHKPKRDWYFKLFDWKTRNFQNCIPRLRACFYPIERQLGLWHYTRYVVFVRQTWRTSSFLSIFDWLISRMPISLHATVTHLLRHHMRLHNYLAGHRPTFDKLSPAGSYIWPLYLVSYSNGMAISRPWWETKARTLSPLVSLLWEWCSSLSVCLSVCLSLSSPPPPPLSLSLEKTQLSILGHTGPSPGWQTCHEPDGMTWDTRLNKWVRSATVTGQM